VFAWFRRRRRAKTRARPFPPAWAEVLETLPLYRRLSEADQAELRGHVLVFLDEKRFEGCGGLEVTDTMKVTVAAHACLLLLHRQTDYYPDLTSILIYPHAYESHQEQVLPSGIVVEGPSVRLGESWTRGEVVLAWDAAEAGFRDVRDGENVILHEFAHQLDQEDGRADGAPPLASRARYAPWARILSREYERLQEAVERGKRTELDAYGATNPAEFFAVVTESFFERPKQLKRKHPQLYEQLRSFYEQDPASA
jgi:Mlc titration factor MtfA (ptsG expression regulator)